MKQIFINSLFVAAALFSAPMTANAAVVYDPNTDYAIGISDFEYGFLTFDVHFRSGSYDDVYGADAPLFSGLEDSAWTAISLIGDILNAETEIPQIADGSSEILWVPFDTIAGNFRAVQLGHETDDVLWHGFASFVGEMSVNYSDAPASWLFATFEDTGTLVAPPLYEPPAVPLPASVFLLLGSIGSLAGLRRKSA